MTQYAGLEWDHPPFPCFLDTSHFHMGVSIPRGLRDGTSPSGIHPLPGLGLPVLPHQCQPWTIPLSSSTDLPSPPHLPAPGRISLNSSLCHKLNPNNDQESPRDCSQPRSQLSGHKGLVALSARRMGNQGPSPLCRH